MADGLRGSIRVEGLDQLRRALQRLPEEVQAKVLPNAVAKGIRPILKEAKSIVAASAFDTGSLHRNIRATRGVRRSTEASSFVSVRRLSRKRIAALRAKQKASGKKINRIINDPFYWKFIEFGTSKMAARSFLRTAFNSKKEDSLEATRTALREGVEREAKKLAWGSGAK